MHKFFARIISLFGNKQANVGMIMALSMIPVMSLVGSGIDYGRAARAEMQLNAFADAAALYGVSSTEMQKSNAQAQTDMTNMFVSQASAMKGVTFNANNVTVSAVNGTTSTSRVATVTYTASTPNLFMNIIGFSLVPIGGTATAKSVTYFQIVFLVDVSNSMAVGGTTTDINNLIADKTIGCAFACHDPNGTIPVAASNYCNSSPGDYFCHAYGPTYCPYGAGNCATVNPSPTYSDRSTLAHTYGYKLKIDYARDAVNSFITQLKPYMDANPALYSAGISTFGTSYAQLQAPTSNSSTLQTGANAISLEVAAASPAGYANQGWTYSSTGLQSLRSALTNVGDGSSATSRKTYVIYITDGVEDTFDAANTLGQYNRWTGYNYATQCQAMKNAGITMFSIQASYPVIPNDSQYTALVANLPSRNNGIQISDTMQSCASASNDYFLASDGPGITTAVNNVFASIFNKPRLTQ